MNLTPEVVHRMKVAELKAELAARGLDTKGVKAILADRLIAALNADPGSAVPLATGNGQSLDFSSPEHSPSKSPTKAASPTKEVPVASLLFSPKKEVEESPGEVGVVEPKIEADVPEPEQTEEKAAEVKQEQEEQSFETSQEKPAEVKQEENVEEPVAEPMEGEVKAEAEPEIKSEAGPEVPSEAEPEVKSEVEPEVKEDSVAEEGSGEGMDVDETGDAVKRKIDEVNGDQEKDAEQAEAKKPRFEVKIPEEKEPEFDDTAVLLDWYKCDLNLDISEENFLKAEPWSTEEFPFAYAGVKATYGFNGGKLYYEVKWVDSKPVKLDFGEAESKYVLRVGWSDLSAGMQLGQEKLSYCWESSGKVHKAGEVVDLGETFDKDDVVGSYLNLESDPVELRFTKNGSLVGEPVQIPKEDLEGKILFPHILSRNVIFEANFGESDAVHTPEEGYSFVSKVEDESIRQRGPKRAEKKEDCEFVMLCGLAGCGKTTWAKKYVTENVDKHYNLLGTSIVVERSLKSQDVLSSSNSNRAYDGFFQRAGKFVEKLIEVAPSRRRNYILDQSNVVPGAQRRKSGGFQGFVRRAVVIVPTEEEYQNRIKMKEQEQGKSVPRSTILEMKAGFRLPEEGETFSAVEFIDLDREKAEELISKYNKEGQSAGFGGRSIPRRGAGYGRFQNNRGGYGRGNMRGDWRGGRGGGYSPRGFVPRGGPRGMSPMRGGPPPNPRGFVPRGMGGPPRGGIRDGPAPYRGGSSGGGNWRGSSGGMNQGRGGGSFQSSYQSRPPRGNFNRGGGGGSGSWRGGDGSNFQGNRGGYQSRPQNGWNDNWNTGRGGSRGGGGGGGGGSNYNANPFAQQPIDPWQQVPDQGFGQRWDTGNQGGGRNSGGGGGGTWQNYSGQTYGSGGGGYSGGRR